MSNGYELRYNILRDARDILFEEWREVCNNKRHMWDVRRDANFNQNDFEVEELVLPSAPTSADIIAKANELYSFVKIKD